VLAYGTGRSHAQSDGLSYKNFEGIASLFGENRFFKSLFDEDVQMIIGEKFEEYKNLINQIFGKIYENEEIRLESFSSREFYFKTLTGGLTTLNSLSDGAQTLFSWFFDMLIRVVQDGYDIEQPEKIHAIVLIDEIDMHLNLHLQKTFIPAIEEIFPLVQFIITTQSPFTIQSMGYNNVLFLENIAGKISVVPFCYAGKPWAWSLTDIFSRMVGHSVELSYKLDKKMTEYRKAKAEQNSELALKIYSELLSAIPENSPVLQYISEL
jgi:predicted ATP-binding protein involved in virulence